MRIGRGSGLVSCLLRHVAFLGSLRDVGPNLFGLGRRAENCQRLLLQDFHPVCDVGGGVAARLVADADLLTHQEAGDFRSQLFARIFRGAERVAPFPIHPARVAAPVSQFVQSDVIVADGVGELASARHVDRVAGAAVIRFIGLVMFDGGQAQTRLGRCLRVPRHGFPGQRRQPVDLFRVENRRKENARLAQLGDFCFWFACGIEHGLSIRPFDGALLLELPVLHQGPLLSPAHLRPFGLGLLVGEPARIGALLGEQLQTVDPLVGLAGGWIVGQVGFARRPRLLPGGRASLKLVDQLFGHHEVKRFSFLCHTTGFLKKTLITRLRWHFPWRPARSGRLLETPRPPRLHRA